MSALAIDLRRTAGYIVADRQGRLVGKVECPMYGTAPDVPDALSVKSGLFSRRRRLVPADTIEQIDGTSGVIGLRSVGDHGQHDALVRLHAWRLLHEHPSVR